MFFNPISDLGFMHSAESFSLYIRTFNVQPTYADISRFLYTLKFGMQW